MISVWSSGVLFFRTIHRVIKCLPLLGAAFIADCNGFVGEVRQFLQLPQYDQLEIDLFSDFHALGTKQQNLCQLKHFVERILTLKPMHLIIESQFFYEIDYKTCTAKDALNHLCSKYYTSEVKPWSFYVAPQDPKATTWIAWELPLILLAIYHDEALPSFITLSDDQRNYIKKNITVDFCDPRMSIDDDLSRLDLNKDHVKAKFESSFKFNEDFLSSPETSPTSSPTKISKAVPRYVESRFQTAVSSPQDSRFCAECFDVEVLTSITKYLTLRSCDQGKKTIVVLCGHWHVRKLKKIMTGLFDDPAFNLTQCSKAWLRLNEQEPLSDDLVQGFSLGMSKIMSGLVERGKSCSIRSTDQLSTVSRTRQRSPIGRSQSPEPKRHKISHVRRKLDFGARPAQEGDMFSELNPDQNP